MINLLILYELNKNVLTMYKISQQIKKDFSAFMLPSYGTIKPALNRLEEAGCLNIQKIMSKGGRPSKYYSLTKTGVQMLKEEMLSNFSDNPVKFLMTARIRLYCAEVLSPDEVIKLLEILKQTSMKIKLETSKQLENSNLSFYQKMVYDNLDCEYKNFISLLEGIERAGKY